MALDAASVASARVPPAAGVAVLDAAHGVVGVDLAQLDLGENHARQPSKHLVHPLSAERADLHRDGDVDAACPPARLGRGYLPSLGRLRGFLLRAEPGMRRRRGRGKRARLDRRAGVRYRGGADAAGGRRREARIDERVGRKIQLVPDQQEREIRGRERARVVEERLQRREGIMRRDIVDEDRSGGTTVVGPRYGAESFGARRVPKLPGSVSDLACLMRPKQGRFPSLGFFF